MDDMKFPFDDNLDSEDFGPSWLDKKFRRNIAIAILIIFVGAIFWPR